MFERGEDLRLTGRFGQGAGSGSLPPKVRLSQSPNPIRQCPAGSGARAAEVDVQVPPGVLGMHAGQVVLDFSTSVRAPRWSGAIVERLT